jgi:hypothetical protein
MMTALSAITVGLFASGCMVTGAMMYKTFGPSPVPAKYTLTKEPTLILVENYRNPGAAGFDAEQIARAVGDQFTKNKVVPLIDQDKLVTLREADSTQYRGMKIQDVGRALGAKQVIYVDLLESGVDVDPSQNALHGHATARVRVVDIATGKSLWPLDMTEGYQLITDIPYGDANASLATAAHNQVVTEMSTAIGHLFYAWKPESEGEADAAQ